MCKSQSLSKANRDCISIYSTLVAVIEVLSCATAADAMFP